MLENLNNDDFVEYVNFIATTAKTMGLGILIIGARQNVIGEVDKVSPSGLLIKNAAVAMNTGELGATDKVDTAQVPPGGVIFVERSRCDMVMVGKKLGLIIE